MSLVIMEMNSETTIICHFLHIRKATMYKNKQIIRNIGEYVENKS